MHYSLSEDLSRLSTLISQEGQSDRSYELFRRVWDNAPLNWKARCVVPGEMKLTRPVIDRDRLRVDRWNDKVITIPNDVRQQLQTWNRNPSSFLTSGAPFVSNHSDNSFTRLYTFLRHINEKANSTMHIQLRFVQISMFHLMKKLVKQQIHRDSDAATEFALRVQIQGDTAELCKNIKKSTAIGSKYASLSEDLGGVGAIICLPADVSGAKYERIPRQGQARVDAIACLKKRGIDKESENEDIKLCYEVGQKIIDFLISDPLFLDQAPVVPDKQKSRKRKRQATIQVPGARSIIENTCQSQIPSATEPHTAGSITNTGINYEDGSGIRSLSQVTSINPNIASLWSVLQSQTFGNGFHYVGSPQGQHVQSDFFDDPAAQPGIITFDFLDDPSAQPGDVQAYFSTF